MASAWEIPNPPVPVKKTVHRAAVQDGVAAAGPEAAIPALAIRRIAPMAPRRARFWAPSSCISQPSAACAGPEWAIRVSLMSGRETAKVSDSKAFFWISSARSVASADRCARVICNAAGALHR
jgi:hypothetical protein